MDQGDPDIGVAWICPIGPGRAHVGAGQDAQARAAPKLHRGGLAVAHIEPQEEPAVGPPEAEAVAEDSFGYGEFLLIAPAVSSAAASEAP